MEKILISVILLSSLSAFSWTIEGSKDLYESLYQFNKHSFFDCELKTYRDSKVAIITIRQKTTGQMKHLILSRNEKERLKSERRTLSLSRRIDTDKRDYSENVKFAADRYGLVQLHYREFLTRPLNIKNEIICNRRR